MTDYRSSTHIPVTIDRSYPQDAYIHSQDVSALQREARVLGYLTDVETPPVDILEGGLSWTGVMTVLEKGPQSHAETSVAGRGVPGWSIACVFAGLVLIGFCMVMLSVVVPLMGTR